MAMLLNIATACAVSKVSAPPPLEVQNWVDGIGVPSVAGEAHKH